LLKNLLRFIQLERDEDFQFICFDYDFKSEFYFVNDFDLFLSCFVPQNGTQKTDLDPKTHATRINERQLKPN
jgi:hypothetical protein